MTESKFHGVIPPVVIPLTAERTLDLEALERSINRMIDAGVDGLFFLGSSGEVAFLTDAQRYHVLQEAVAMVHGRVPVLAGIIDMETLRVVDQAKRATGYGVDGLVATAPFYALGGPKETERHFRAIREQTDLPLFAYDLPVCVHTKLDPTMLVRLGEDGVIQGVKDSSGDDVSFRWLCLETKMLAILCRSSLATRCASMALTWLAPMAPFRALPISTPTATLSSGRLSRLAIGRRFARFRTISLA